jgi:hypothetical protein
MGAGRLLNNEVAQFVGLRMEFSKGTIPKVHFCDIRFQMLSDDL